MLTDSAKAGAESLVTWLIFGSYCVMTYSLVQHFGWVDGLAIVAAFAVVMRAITRLGARTTEEGTKSNG